MRVLLDTNVLLLFAFGSATLSPRVRALIEDQQDELLVSAVTPLELAIKSSRGKLLLPAELDEFYSAMVAEMRARELPVTARHALGVQALPPIHGDPFDRLLVAQAQLENAGLATNDPAFRRYGVEVIW